MLSERRERAVDEHHRSYRVQIPCGAECNGVIDIFGGTYSEMKDSIGRYKRASGTDKYTVISGFKDWTSGKKYKSGEILVIADDQNEHFSWALSAGKLKRKGS